MSYSLNYSKILKAGIISYFGYYCSLQLTLSVLRVKNRIHLLML